ncbi:MAG TPA: hypothetical protein VHD33_06255 [Legionellaceae bacterium]|nr:hypothetical protein [Legionellaceae bacterium]
MYIPALIKNIQITEEPNTLTEQCKSKFKDNLTKASEVFLSQILNDEAHSKNDSFILSTSIGNTENIVKLINEYRNQKFVSAQLFPEATMSSAAVNINRLFGFRGGNMSSNPNLALNDAILLGLLDAAYNLCTTHLMYGEVNDLEQSSKTPNHLLYIKMIPSYTGSYIQLRDTHQDIYDGYDDLSIYLKSIMSPALYQFTSITNLRGEVLNVYYRKQVV